MALEPTSFAAEAQAGFDRDGFIEIPTLIPTSVVARLNNDLEKVLRGGITDGGVADKLPKLADQQKRGATLWATSKKTLQAINVWKCFPAFRELFQSQLLG